MSIPASEIISIESKISNMPKHYEQLIISKVPSNWGPGAPMGYHFQPAEIESIDVGLNNVLLQVYYSGLTAVERDPNYDITKEAELMVLPVKEVIGTIVKLGTFVDRKAFKLNQVVLGFDPLELGLATFVAVPDNKIYAIPGPDARYLFALSPMVTSACLLSEHLSHLGPGTNMLVNMVGSGIGASICQDAHSKGFNIFGIDYAYKKNFEEYSKLWCKKVVRVVNLTTEVYQQKVKDAFEVVVMPAILALDTEDVYRLLVGLMDQRNSSKLILLCEFTLTHTALEALAKCGFATQMSSSGIAVSFFSINSRDRDYSSTIKLNVEALKDNKRKVVQHEQVSGSLNGIITDKAYPGLLKGKFVGQRIVELLKPPQQTATAASAIG